jgi:hypothetical protein
MIVMADSGLYSYANFKMVLDAGADALVALLCMMDAAYPGEFDDSLHSEDTALVLFMDVLRAAGMQVPDDTAGNWSASLASLATLTEKLQWLVGQLPTDGFNSASQLEQWEPTSRYSAPTWRRTVRTSRVLTRATRLILRA